LNGLEIIGETIMTIDLSSSIPIYYQLKNVLLRKIKEKNWKPGELIPSEKDLQIIYGISRTPVRQALLELEREGYIIRK
jgi:GntR family transcriptional regulator